MKTKNWLEKAEDTASRNSGYSESLLDIPSDDYSPM